MQQEVVLQVQQRDNLRRSDARRIRNRGDIPAVVYGKQKQPKMIVIDGVQFRRLHMGNRGLVRLQIQGDGEVNALIQEVQRDPLSFEVVHIDFHAVSLTDPVEADVAVYLDGLEKVEKRGGIIQQQVRELRVRCLPTDVPEHILVNISQLDIGEHIVARDITLPANVELRSDPEEIIVNVVTTRAGETGQEPEDRTPGVLKDRDNTGVASDGKESAVKA